MTKLNRTRGYHPFVKQGGKCRIQNAGFLRSFSMVLFSFPLLFPHTAYGDINADLLEAAKIGNTAKVEQLLKQGADANAETEDGWTAVMDAAVFGHTETVKAFIDAGADVNAKQKDGRTVLMWAVGRGRTENVKALIDAGADTNAENEDGKTALMIAAGEGRAEIVDILKQDGARR